MPAYRVPKPPAPSADAMSSAALYVLNDDKLARLPSRYGLLERWRVRTVRHLASPSRYIIRRFLITPTSRGVPGVAVCSLVFAASIGSTVAHLRQRLAPLQLELAGSLPGKWQALHMQQLSRSMVSVHAMRGQRGMVSARLLVFRRVSTGELA